MISDNTNSKWQEDWPSFADVLQKLLRANVDEADLSNFFSGKTITWVGTLAESDLDDIAPTVSIDVCPMRIDLDHGCAVTVTGFSLDVAESAVAAWKQKGLGEDVCFSAKFLDRNSPFPCLDIQRFSTGEAFLGIGLEDGRLR